jgi:DNA replication protein DnaD
MVTALVEAGFLDEDENGLAIHDWFEYAGRLVEKREQNKERKRRSRARHADVTLTSHGQDGDGNESHRATKPNQTIPNQTITAAANAHAREENPETFAAAYVRVYQRELTPFQAEQLAAYIDQEGFEEAVVVRAIERAALSGGGIKLVLHILNDYAAAGAKTLAGALAFDAEHDARKQRGDPVKTASAQQAKIEYFRQKRKEAEQREAAGNMGLV